MLSSILLIITDVCARICIWLLRLSESKCGPARDRECWSLQLCKTVPALLLVSQCLSIHADTTEAEAVW